MYTFVQMKCHPKIRHLKVWCLKILAAEMDIFASIHTSVATHIFLRFGKDPHLFYQDMGEAREEESRFCTPLHLAGLWGETVERVLQEFGYVLINESGGLFPPRKPLRPLATVHQKECVWPDSYTKKYADELITILRWQDGKHYYLKSNRGRIFLPDKHNSFRAAKAVAKNFVPSNKILFQEETGYRYKHEGG